MSTSDLTLAGETLPAETPETVLSDADLAALRRAVQVLERPSLAARLSAAAGAPLDIIGRSLPAPVTEAVSTTAGCWVSIRLSASSPDEAVSTSYPHWPTRRASPSRSAGSSSTTRILPCFT